MLANSTKKTWGGHWFSQGSFFVATFVAGAGKYSKYRHKLYMQNVSTS